MRCLLFLGVMLCTALSGADARALAMELSNISDFSLGTWSMGDPAVSSSMDVCVYSLLNSPSGSYAITVTGTNGYVLKNGTHQIPYSLYWDASGAGNLGAGSTQLTSGTKLSGLGNANTVSPLCVSGVIGPNARLTLKIAQSDMAAALAGTYSGTITLLLSPN